jgi:hypothetical protein
MDTYRRQKISEAEAGVFQTEGGIFLNCVCADIGMSLNIAYRYTTP